MNPALASAALSLGGMLVTELAARPDSPPPDRLGATRFRTGDLLCPGIDVDDFEAGCRMPVFRDSWNRWRFFYTSKHGATPEQVRSVIYDYLGTINGRLAGRLRQAKVWVDEPQPGWVPLVSRLNACAYGMTLAASELAPAFWPVYVEAVYRGTETHAPWVALQGSPTPHTCPTSADLLLDTVYAPSQVDVPGVETDSPLPPNVDPDNQGLPALTPDLDFSTKLALGGVGLLAVAVLAGYAIRSVK